jgi:hypothetical protein
MEEQQNATAPSAPSTDTRPQEWLTDFIDQLSRSAFQRAFERRHAAPAYRTVIESAQLVATPSP